MKLKKIIIFVAIKFNFMKKHLLLIIATLTMSLSIAAQNVISLEKPEVSTEKEGWTGNQNVSLFVRLQDSEFVIAPYAIDSTLSGIMTKVKFCRNPYQDYNTNSYAVKIYENIDLQLVDPIQDLYDSSSCGDLVYEQPFICDGTGWQEIELETPYELPEGDFWVSIRINGMGTVVIGDEANAVEGEYLYLDMLNYTYYWRHTYFDASAGHLLFSCGMAIYTEDNTQSCGEVNSAAFKAYPNPANDILTVEADAMQEIEIFDNIGRKIFSKATDCQQEKIDLSGFPKGIYVVKVVTENGVGEKKVLVD